jgi:peroxiredoxin
MVELGQLEARHEDFEKRNTRVVVVSLDNVEDSAKTQQKFPHLTVVSDDTESLAKAAELIAPQHSPTGGDTLAPTTVLLDRDGVVRWVSRKDNYLERPPPDEVLAAVDAHAPKGR